MPAGKAPEAETRRDFHEKNDETHRAGAFPWYCLHWRSQPAARTWLSGGDGGSKDTEGGIGDTLSNMFFDYTVLEATSPAEYDGYTAAEGNRLIVCSVKVKNTFGETIPMYDSDFQLQWGNIGGDDDDYTFSLDAFNDTMMPLEYELADGEEVTYDLVFEAPADVKDFGLVYLEEYYTGSESESGTGDFFSVNFTVE